MDPLQGLASLKDLEGVYGSFVIDAEGTPLLRDLPVVIGNDSLEEAGPRISRLWLALPSDDPQELLELHFSSHKICVKRIRAGSLCVFVAPRVQLLALSTALSVVEGILERELDVSSPHPPAEQANTQAPPETASDNSPPEKEGKVLVYRGQRFFGR